MMYFLHGKQKSPGYKNLHVTAMRSLSYELKIPLMNSFSQSISTGIFPDKMKSFTYI